MAVKDSTKLLTLSQQVAIEAINADIGRLRMKLRAVMAEAGLDPDGRYSVSLDGEVTVVEQNDAGT